MDTDSFKAELEDYSRVFMKDNDNMTFYPAVLNIMKCQSLLSKDIFHVEKGKNLNPIVKCTND